MKIAILALVVLAIIGPGAVTYKLKGPWTNPRDRRRWCRAMGGGIGGILILIAMEMLA